MSEQKTQKSKNKTPNTNKGITLIALVITIIIMLILVGVTISMAVNGGLFDYAGKAVGDMNNALKAEQQLSNGGIKIGGTYYNSIDEYLGITEGEDKDEEEGPVKITLSISGTDVEEIPVPDGFTHTEGTIEEGYVITDEVDAEGNSIGNEFVWVPVKQGQKIKLKVESEKDIEKIEIYDPYGAEIDLEITEGNIGKTYDNTQIEPTVNGMYMAVVSTVNGTNEDGTPKYEITQETLTVKSLYASDTWNDYLTSEEYAKLMVAGTEYEKLEKKEIWELMCEVNGMGSLETAMQNMGCSTLEHFITILTTREYKDITDYVDYSDSVLNNGGFFVARYEAGKAVEGKPVSKEGAYPYNNVSWSQALELTDGMYSSNSEFEVDLVTYSAWCRMLDWIYETSEDKTTKLREIMVDASDWGNTFNSTFVITTGEYSEDKGETFKTFSEKYTKIAGESVLLTTGATEQFCEMNIYDLAGNLSEWFLSTGLDEDGNVMYSYSQPSFLNSYGLGMPSRTAGNDTIVDGDIGFRPALYLAAE